MTQKNKILDGEHYVDVVGVMEWLYDENKYQKIRFDRENCFKYKFDNKLHRSDGPAIEYYSGGGEYYLDDEKVTEEFYINNKRYETLDKILKPLKKI